MKLSSQFILGAALLAVSASSFAAPGSGATLAKGTKADPGFVKRATPHSSAADPGIFASPKRRPAPNPESFTVRPWPKPKPKPKATPRPKHSR